MNAPTCASMSPALSLPGFEPQILKKNHTEFQAKLDWNFSRPLQEGSSCFFSLQFVDCWSFQICTDWHISIQCHPTSLPPTTWSNMFTHVHVLSQRQLDQRCERSRSSSQCHRPLKQILHLDEYLRLAKLPRQMDRVFVSFLPCLCWSGRYGTKQETKVFLAMRPCVQRSGSTWWAMVA
jgi:hypothetical protein